MKLADFWEQQQPPNNWKGHIGADPATPGADQTTAQVVELQGIETESMATLYGAPAHDGADLVHLVDKALRWPDPLAFNTEHEADYIRALAFGWRFNYALRDEDSVSLLEGYRRALLDRMAGDNWAIQRGLAIEHKLDLNRLLALVTHHLETQRITRALVRGDDE